MHSRTHWLLGMAAALAAPLGPLAGQSPIRAAVRGMVFDSVSMAPLRGALVRIVRADDPSVGRSRITDSAGTFRHDSVPAGVWLATFLHPTLDSLRVEAAVLRLDITDSGTVELPLATPAPRTIARSLCRGLAADAALLTGIVRDADDDSPLADASVQVEWPEWVLEKGQLTTVMAMRRVPTDGTGRYAICGVPTASTMRARSWRAADSAGVIEVTTDSSGFALQDFAIARAGALMPSPQASPVASGNPPLGDSLAGGAPARSRAVLRGHVTTENGAPLPNAIVRVIGTGSIARTSDAGDFRIADADAGTQTVEVRAIGYSPQRRAVRLRTTEESSVSLALPTRHVELDTIRVMAGREIPSEVRSLERRWRTGLGRFLNAADVAERATLYTSDALRGMPGVFLRMAGPGEYGQEIRLRSNGGDECRAILYLDGLPVNGAGRSGFTLDEAVFLPDVGAIEVYARPSMVPAEYIGSFDCGVVAVWSKQALGNVPVQPPKSGRVGAAPKP